MPDTSNMRTRVAEALRGHRLDSMSQDSGNHCVCGSDSRFEQRDGDHPWATIDEHLADVVLRVIQPEIPHQRSQSDDSH